ncbi:MFS transporter [Terribacillus sp. 7520-G]|uniref:MFS transporter n=1 Tax=Terribacillus TaxID=459532 RepID=UPI000BA6DC27|nr:MFS transporter [Terribacillus sp. 7520-G]PAD37628.1 MFS transporter [Terribacillus sp. 7520-G]
MKAFFSRHSAGKYSVLVLLFIGWCISYIDRAAISIALASIGADFNLDSSVLGIVLSVFFIGYAAMQIPGGWLADRFGSKNVILSAILLWSVFTAITGLAWSLASLIAIRLLFGLGEGAYPSASIKGLAENFPKEQRPKMSSVMLSSNYIGSAIAPLLVAPLLLAFGWRNLFFIIGIAGVVFALIYWFWVKPVKPKNMDQIQTGQAIKKTEKVPLKQLLATPILWQLALIWFGMSLINKGLDSWMPTYLLTERGLDLKAIGLLTPLPFIAAGISTAIGGWVMVKFFDGREKILLITSASITAIFLYFMYTAQTVGSVIAFQGIVYFFKSFVLATTMALPLKILSGKVAGSAAGVINLFGQSAGFVSPVIIGIIVEVSGSFGSAFWFLIVAACLSVAISFMLNTRKHRHSNANVQAI